MSEAGIWISVLLIGSKQLFVHNVNPLMKDILVIYFFRKLGGCSYHWAKGQAVALVKFKPWCRAPNFSFHPYMESVFGPAASLCQIFKGFYSCASGFKGYSMTEWQ